MVYRILIEEPWCQNNIRLIKNIISNLYLTTDHEGTKTELLGDTTTEQGIKGRTPTTAEEALRTPHGIIHTFS